MDNDEPMDGHHGYFAFTNKMKNLLFYGLDIKTSGDLFGVVVVLALVCVIYEGIRVLREYLFLQTDTTCCEASTGEVSRLWPCGARMTRGERIKVHTEQTGLHALQVTLGYILMLCVMTFNAWVFITFVLSVGLGYFLLGAVIPKQYLFTTSNNQEENSTGRGSVSSCCQDQQPRSYSAIETVSSKIVE